MAKRTKGSRKAEAAREKAAAGKAAAGQRAVRKNKAAGKQKATPGKSRRKTNEAVPIVGIGASAGGLEAFTHLLGALPADTGMAFVMVSHLSHTHKSMLTELLARTTPMQVSQVTGDDTGRRQPCLRHSAQPESVDQGRHH
jgi:chemotaxis response regulator CheB